MDLLISTIRTAWAHGWIGTLLAVPRDAGSFFVPRWERLSRSVRERVQARRGERGSDHPC